MTAHAVTSTRREIVLCETLKLFPMSRIGSPASRRLITSFIWCGVNFGLRPIFTPRAFASTAFSHAGADKILFKLSKPAEHGQHQPTV